jgi:hypothetical protein
MLIKRPDEVSERRALEEKSTSLYFRRGREMCGRILLTFPLFVSFAATDMSHEDARQGELCVERRIRNIHINVLGESGRVAGERVEAL